MCQEIEGLGRREGSKSEGESKYSSVFLRSGPSSSCSASTNHSHHSFPSNFTAAVYITFLLQVIEVKFEKLDLEPDAYCRYDYVALFNGGEKDNSRRIGKFCGDRAPG